MRHLRRNRHDRSRAAQDGLLLSSSSLGPSHIDQTSKDTEKRVDSHPKQTSSDPIPTSSVRNVLEIVGLVATPVTLATALMYYFGLIRTRAFVSFFGIDPSILTFSTQDYLFRSVDPMFVPLSIMATLGLVGLWVHSRVSSWPKTGKHRRRHGLAVNGAGLVGLGMLAVGVSGLVPGTSLNSRLLIAPLAFALGVALTSYAVYCHETKLELGNQPSLIERSSLRLGYKVLTWILIVIGLFWATHQYAEFIGVGRASQYAAELWRRPGVVLYSAKRLGMNTSGVNETELTPPEAGYRYRYTGIKLFIYSNNTYIFLPADWWTGQRIAIVVPKSDAMRLDFITP